MAESDRRFEISRAETKIHGHAGTLTAIVGGDAITATDQPVRIQTVVGDTVFIQKNSAAALASGDQLKVIQGDILVAIAAKSELEVGVDDLVISPLGEGGASDGQKLLGVSRPTPNRVRVVGFDRTVRVKDMTRNEQLAVLSDRDSMEFVKTPKGWILADADKEGSEKELGNPDDAGKTDEDATTTTKRRRAAWIWWFGGLAAGAAVAGAAVAVTTGNNNNGGGGWRNPSSPIEPPGGGGGGGGGGHRVHHHTHHAPGHVDTSGTDDHHDYEHIF